MDYKGIKINLRERREEDFEAYFHAINCPEFQEGEGTFVPLPRSIAQYYFNEEMKRGFGPEEYRFVIETRDGGGIGLVNLLDVNPAARCADLSIGIWDRKNQGKGYASEAIKIILKFAFEELGLHRVGLHNGVYEFNMAAINLYEKCGFKMEGAKRQAYYHRDRWWDLIQMSILENEYRGK